MARLNRMLDIVSSWDVFIVHDLGDYRRHRRFAACCFLSRFRSRSLIYVSLPRALAETARALCEFPIPDVLNSAWKDCSVAIVDPEDA